MKISDAEPACFLCYDLRRARRLNGGLEWIQKERPSLL